MGKTGKNGRGKINEEEKSERRRKENKIERQSGGGTRWEKRDRMTDKHKGSCHICTNTAITVILNVLDRDITPNNFLFQTEDHFLNKKRKLVSHNTFPRADLPFFCCVSFLALLFRASPGGQNMNRVEGFPMICPGPVP